MPSKCHLNGTWPLELFHHINLGEKRGHSDVCVCSSHRDEKVVFDIWNGHCLPLILSISVSVRNSVTQAGSLILAQTRIQNAYCV